MHRSGLAAAACGDFDAARAWIAAAIRRSGPTREYCESLARVFTAEGKNREAAACYEQALVCAPDDVPLRAALARAMLLDRRPREASGIIAALLRDRPGWAEGWHILGAALHECGNLTDAAEALRHAVHLDPDSPEPCFDLALTFARLGHTAQAEDAYRAALRAKPAYPEAHNNLGNLLRRSGRTQSAIPCFQNALQLRPGFVEARYNLGLAMQAVDRLEDARDCYRAVLRRDSALPAAHNNLANTLQDLGLVDQAIPHYERAVLLQPDCAEYRINLGMAQLLTGDFAAGWRNYAFRVAGESGGARWDGSPLKGARILLRAEQGLGDTLQFIRYARQVKENGGSVWVECPAPLSRLLSTHDGLDGLASTADALDYPWQTPLLDLPRLFGTMPDSISRDVPYLSADPGLADWWAETLHPSTARMTVGIAWRGSPDHRNDRHRSIPAGDLSALAGLPETRFVPLQKECPSGDAAAALRWQPLARPLTDFADTAALMMNLDLVVSVDTAVAHLAGALARPVWTLLPFAPDWRWMLGREDTPWYPTMRLFRQRARGDWSGVLHRVRSAMESWTTSGRGSPES
jgi:tetratricopeptide (TPR) repeat protein